MKRVNMGIIFIVCLFFVATIQGQIALASDHVADPETILQQEAAQRMRLETQLISNQGTNITPIWPCSGEVTSLYGWRIHPIFGDWRFHYGIDIGVNTGTSVMAPLNGIVSDISRSDAVGNVVEINHGSGVYTRFCHLLKALVTVGQTVTQGQIVALSDNTGYLSTGAHLHFEVYDFNDSANVDGTIDPLLWLSSQTSRVTQLITSGAFDADSNSDGALLNGYWNDASSLKMLKSNGDTMTGSTGWESGVGNFDSKRAKLVSGYFVGDGKSDIAVLYNYGNANTGAIVFESNGAGFTPHTLWVSGPGNWDWTRAKITAGDFNRDGFTDIMALYDYGGANTAVIIFECNGSSFTPRIVWLSGPGNWDWSHAKLTAGDYNADGYSDLMVLYDYGCSNTGAIIFKSNGVSVTPQIVWSSGPGNMDWSRMKVEAGNFNGDPYDDIAVLYDYGGANTAAIVMQFNGVSFANRVAWSSGPCNWEWTRTELTVCDFNGDRYADIVALYNYGGGNTAAVVFKSNGTLLAPHVAWLGTPD